MIFHLLLDESCGRLRPVWEARKNRKMPGLLLAMDIFFELDALTPLPFSTAGIIGLFLGTGLTNKLDRFKD